MYLISDVHYERNGNRAFVDAIGGAHEEDVVIVAGYVTESLELLEECLVKLKRKFGDVFFTFGNHECWLNGKDEDDDGGSSFEKIKRVLEICERIGVKCELEKVDFESDDASVFIAPIHSYYHPEWDVEPDIDSDIEIPPTSAVMMDYRLANWDSVLLTSSSNDVSSDEYIVAKRIDSLNENWTTFLEDLKEEKKKAKRVKVISLSHFLPRMELVPEKRFLLFPNLTQACGSTLLRERVESIANVLNLDEGEKNDKLTHCFGHTHFSWNLVLDHVRYVQCALATPKEWQRRPRSLVVGEFQSNEPGQESLQLYDGFMNTFTGEDINDSSALWSNFYVENGRKPENRTLAPWVKDCQKNMGK